MLLTDGIIVKLNNFPFCRGSPGSPSQFSQVFKTNMYVCVPHLQYVCNAETLQVWTASLTVWRKIMLRFQTHAWRQLPREIKPRGEEETSTKTANPSYLRAMNSERETSARYQMGRVHIASQAQRITESVWHSCQFSRLVSEPLHRAAQSQNMGGRRASDGRGCGVLSGRGHMAQACGYRLDQNLFCSALAQDDGEWVCHTQSLIVFDGSDDLEEEIPSEVTHPLKYFPLHFF